MTKPITPAEAASETFEEIDYLLTVSKINKQLRNGGRTFQRSSIDPDMLPKIMREYIAAGWHVELVYDWRDGDYLRFKEMV